MLNDNLKKGNKLFQRGLKVKMNKIQSLNILWLFGLFQILMIGTYLVVRNSQTLDFSIYLQSIKYSTIILLIISIIFLLQKLRYLSIINLLFLTFISQILILYFTMLIHTDLKAITSPTILLMMVLFVVFSTKDFNEKIFNYFILNLVFINFLFTILQIFNILNVAQNNEREILNTVTERPTGIFFNAFSMSYASIFTFLICIYFYIIKIIKNLNFMAATLSLISIIASGTRTPLLIAILLGSLIITQSNLIVQKYSSIIAFGILTFIIFIPIASIIYGNATSNENLATLNGRTLLWDCVLSQWEKFIPFGVGVQSAFPPGFCSDDSWFSKLRHPENMFLLNYVESGPLGVLGLMILFTVTFRVSFKCLNKGNALPLGLTCAYLLASIFYVPFFHYLPFLTNRTADRGIYNFFLITIIWFIMLNYSKNKENMTKLIKR